LPFHIIISYTFISFWTTLYVKNKWQS